MSSSATGVRQPSWRHVIGWLQRHRTVFFRYVAPVLRKMRVARPLFRLYERALSMGERGNEHLPDDGLPVPSAHLRVLVNGSPALGDFLGSGRQGADSITSAFAESGLQLSAAGALLDFGCGCGRILRHWRSLEHVEIYGCDYNDQLVRWTDQNLPNVTAQTNDLAPPAPFADEQFGAVYAISVFTHLTLDLHRAWMADLLRMLRPGGRLLFTTHGQTMTGGLLSEERARFDDGELVVRFDSDVGSNLCNAFHPEPWVRGVLAKGLDVSLVWPGGAPGLGEQDVWVVRK